MKCLCHFTSLLQDDSEVAPKISGCSTPRLLASGPLEEISSISLIAEGMVVKKSDTIRAILPTQWHVCLQATTVRFNMQYPEGANRS